MCILFVHNQPTRFVEIDRDLLAGRYRLTELFEKGPARIRPQHIASQVRAHDLVFCWFASWHSLIPVLLARVLHRPSIVVIGGYDTANLPEVGYGAQRGGLRRLVARTVIRHATCLIAFSVSAQREAITSAGADPAKLSVIFQGIDAIPMGRSDGRERIALTVGGVWRENLQRKGLLPFVQAAGYVPDARFIHVGRWCDDSIDDLRRVAGPNVEFKGFLPDEELADLYTQAAVYVQPSLHEGFGMSVAEAMLAGCIPVVTRRGALPEVVGDTGVYMPSAHPPDIAGAVRQALAMDGPARRRARERVVTQFPLERRRQALYALIDSLLPVSDPRQ